MEGYGVSQQTDEGYSEDPFNNASDHPAAPYKPLPPPHADAASNPLSNTQLKAWMFQHIASLPTELRARAYCPSFSRVATPC